MTDYVNGLGVVRPTVPAFRFVGLQLPVQLHRAAGKTDQPRYQRRQRAEQKQDLESAVLQRA